MEVNNEQRRKKILYRSWHRGIREVDLLLGGFADQNLNQLSEKQLTQYETLLEQSDPDLLSWITGQKTVPNKFNNDLMGLLKSFSNNTLCP